jgi:hypothetical protein
MVKSRPLIFFFQFADVPSARSRRRAPASM